MNKQQIKNAMAIVNQIKNDEWEFKGHGSSKFECFTAERNGVELWVANGLLFCGIRNKRHELGFIGGAIVWILAARAKVIAKELEMKPKTSDLTK